MTFYPTLTPVAYWGWDAAEGPCSPAKLGPLLLTPGAGSSGMLVMSFEDSPYGFVLDATTVPTLTPYEIDPTTLQIALGTPVSGPSGRAGAIAGAIVLDDSTMVFGSSAGGFYAISRSGLTLTISSAQQATSNISVQNAIRLDSSHFVRGYTETGTLNSILQVFSVSGTTISLVHSDTITTNFTATLDPGGTPVVMDHRQFLPFHYDGSGTLYTYGNTDLTFPGNSILASPFSIAGGVGTPGSSTRAHPESVTTRAIPRAAKSGTSECVLGFTTGGRVGFWDDGTNMHVGTSSADAIDAFFINHNGEKADNVTTQPSYLTPEVEELPLGTVLETGPALVTQSGLTFTYSLITPRFLCPQYGTLIAIDPTNPSQTARHGSNLGAMLIDNPFVSDGKFLIRAYDW